MDAAKHTSVEVLCENLTQYAPLAALVVVTLLDVPKEVFEALAAKYPEHPLDNVYQWDDANMQISTHHKHCDLGSGVVINVAYTEVEEKGLVI
jgi:hypothetical protein